MAFVKGVSGNPGGKPRELKAIQELARKHAPDALNALVKVAKSGKSESARVSAAEALLNRGYGKPHQTISATVNRIDADTLPDAELAAIATGGRSDTSEAAPDPARLN